MNKEMIIKVVAVIAAMILITGAMVAVLKRGEAIHSDENEAVAEAPVDVTVAASKPTVTKAVEPTEGIEMPAESTWPLKDDPTTKFNESTLREIPGGANPTMDIKDVSMNGIMCWGDSLTAGYTARPEAAYPYLLNQWLKEDGIDCEVVNMGATGEDSRAIAARAGGIKMYSRDALLLPSDASAQDVELVDETGHGIRIQLYDSVGINPCTVPDSEGNPVEVEIKNTEIYTGYGRYIIRPYNLGPNLELPAMTQIKPQGADLHPDYLPIIFAGNNKGFEDLNEYISQIDSIINDKDYKHIYIVIGITMPGVVDFDEYDKVMEAAYGNHYLNFRKYLAEYDYTEFGYYPNESDRNCYLHGDYSPWMLASDGEHFSELNYSLLAKAVYEKIYELGYDEGLV